MTGVSKRGSGRVSPTSPGRACFACVFVGLALGGASNAQDTFQPQHQPSPGAEQPAGVSREATLNRVFARELTRVALMDFRLQASPSATDLLTLDALLEIAQGIEPENLELIHRRIDIAYRLGDNERLEARTREVLRVDPRDTVATLRLITLQIGRLQTVAERLGAYERFIASDRLDQSVRSRLALDAALLAQEQGDDASFSRLLTRAVQLDSTNKEAAALAATYFAQRVADDPAGRLELSINLLLADPLDPNVHLTLARQLARFGAFLQAMRFHALASRIFQADSGRMSDQLQLERLVLSWHLQGPEAPLKELVDTLSNQRYAAEMRLQQLRAQGLPTTGVPASSDVRLGEAFELLRVLSAHAAGDQQELGRALFDMRGNLDKARALLANPQDLPAGATIEDVRGLVARLDVSLFLLHAWTGLAMDQIAPGIQNSPQIMGENADPMLRAFASLHTEPPEVAEERFRALLGREALAWAGLALALERQGRIDDAVAAYATLARTLPISPEGAWARSRAAQISGMDVLASPITSRLADLAAGVPVWVDRMIADPSSAVQMRVSIEDQQVAPLEAIRVRVHLTNVAPVALALGSDRPIQSRLLLAPTIDVGVESRDLASLPEVVDIGRRLRLAPREELIAEFDAVPGFTGWYLDTSSDASARVRARVLQGFRPSQGTLIAGPLALTSETGRIVRTVAEESRMTSEELSTWIREGSEDRLPLAMLAVRNRLLSVPGMSSPEERFSLIDACVARYEALSPEARAVCLLILPSVALVPEIALLDDRAIELATGESDRCVLTALLMTRTRSATSPVLDHPVVASDPLLATIARTQRTRLIEGGARFAGAGPALADLAGARVGGS